MDKYFITGAIGSIGGVLMAFKNKLEIYMILFSGVTAYFIPQLILTLIEKYLFKLDDETAYSIGFFSGMSAFYIIQYYDEFLQFLFFSVKNWINKKIGK